LGGAFCPVDKQEKRLYNIYTSMQAQAGRISLPRTTVRSV